MAVRPETYIRQLVSALGNRDVPLGLFLGAGCGASVKVNEQPLIPPILPLSELIRAELRTSHERTMVCLENQLGPSSDNGRAANIEELLSRIRALREVASDEPVFGLTAADLEQLDEAISAAIVKHVSVDLPVGRTSYTQFARWAASFERRTPLEIFTTNYDLLIEQALERMHWPVFDGFVGSHRPFFDLTSIEIDSLPVRWLRLWKVHGSVNWQLGDDGWVVKAGDGKKLLIYPSHLKYAESRRMPYLAIRDRLRNFFRTNPAVFITCGYSFADQHINEDLAFGLRANRGAICFALLFGPIENYGNARTIALNHSNLTLLAEDKAVVRSRELDWAADERMPLGDFATFADFLVTEVMGQDKNGT